MSNMNSMGIASIEKECLSAIEPRHVWTPLFKGRHVSTDWRWSKGNKDGGNMPQVCLLSTPHSITGLYVHADAGLPLQEYLSNWISDPKMVSGVWKPSVAGLSNSRVA